MWQHGCRSFGWNQVQSRLSQLACIRRHQAIKNAARYCTRSHVPQHEAVVPGIFNIGPLNQRAGNQSVNRFMQRTGYSQCRLFHTSKPVLAPIWFLPLLKAPLLKLTALLTGR